MTRYDVDVLLLGAASILVGLVVGYNSGRSGDGLLHAVFALGLAVLFVAVVPPRRPWVLRVAPADGIRGAAGRCSAKLGTYPHQTRDETVRRPRRESDGTAGAHDPNGFARRLLPLRREDRPEHRGDQVEAVVGVRQRRGVGLVPADVQPRRNGPPSPGSIMRGEKSEARTAAPRRAAAIAQLPCPAPTSRICCPGPTPSCSTSRCDTGSSCRLAGSKFPMSQRARLRDLSSSKEDTLGSFRRRDANRAHPPDSGPGPERNSCRSSSQRRRSPRHRLPCRSTGGAVPENARGAASRSWPPLRDVRSCESGS